MMLMSLIFWKKFEEEFPDEICVIMQKSLPAAMGNSALRHENDSLYLVVIRSLGYMYENAKILNALFSGNGTMIGYNQIIMLY